MNLLFSFLNFKDMKSCQREHSDRASESHQRQHHHHHNSHHHHHHRHRDHSKGGAVQVDNEQMLPPSIQTPDSCCHGHTRYLHGHKSEGSPSHTRLNRKSVLAASREHRSLQHFGHAYKSKHRPKDINEWVL